MFVNLRFKISLYTAEILLKHGSASKVLRQNELLVESIDMKQLERRTQDDGENIMRIKRFYGVRMWKLMKFQNKKWYTLPQNFNHNFVVSDFLCSYLL